MHLRVSIERCSQAHRSHLSLVLSPHFPPFLATRSRLSLYLCLHQLFSLSCQKTDKSSVKHIASITMGPGRKWSATIFFPISQKIETINSFPLQSTPPPSLQWSLFYLLYKYESWGSQEAEPILYCLRKNEAIIATTGGWAEIFYLFIFFYHSRLLSC